jgi:hypothetical protein
VDLLSNHQQQPQNLSTSSATTSTPPTSTSSSPLQKDEIEPGKQLSQQDTMDNLTFNLLKKLTLENGVQVEAEDQPLPPVPSTPVSSLIAALNEPSRCYKNIFDKFQVNVPNNSPNSPPNQPQLIIDDVLLMSRDDGRPVVPLAEQELSFTVADKSKDDFEEIKEIVEEQTVSTVVEEEEESKPDKNQAFMTLISKIAPHSHLVEYCFEYEASSNEERDIKLTGSFNNWEQFLPMTRDHTNRNRWFKSLMLAPGIYEYKFVINNSDWKFNKNMPCNGNNNVLTLLKI